MTRIDQIIADALAGSPETHVAILAREVVRLRGEASAVVVPELTRRQSTDIANEAQALTGRSIWPSTVEAIAKVMRSRAIPADRVLGEGMMAAPAAVVPELHAGIVEELWIEEGPRFSASPREAFEKGVKVTNTWFLRNLQRMEAAYTREELAEELRADGVIFDAAGLDHELARRNISRLHSVPADRALGEGMVEELRLLRDALVELCDSQLSSRDREGAIARGLAALRANKGGANHD